VAIASVDNIIAAIAAGRSGKAAFQKITTNAVASVAYRWHEAFSATGVPAGVPLVAAAGVATAMTKTAHGGLDFGVASVAPLIRHLTCISAVSPTATMVPATLILCDLLLTYQSLAVTGVPTVLDNSVTLPRYTDGLGVQGIIAVQTALGATTPTLTLNVRFDDNTDAAVATMSSPGTSIPVSTLFQTTTGAGCFLPLNSGKLGIKKINSYTLASGTTGTVWYGLVKEIARIPLVATAIGSERDLLFQMPSLPRVYDEAYLGWILNVGGALVASSVLLGSIDVCWG